MTEAEVWMITVKLPDTPQTRDRIGQAIEHDFLLYEGNGMRAQNLSEWMRFLINRRLTDITEGRK